MLFRSIPTLDIISLPEHSAEISYIRGGSWSPQIANDQGNTEEYIIYRINASFDEYLAMQQNALDLKIEVYKQKPPPLSNNSRSIKNSTIWAAATRNIENNIRQLKQARDESRIASMSIDLTSYISNDLAASLKPNNLNISSFSRKQTNSIVSNSYVVPAKNPFSKAQVTVASPTTQGILASLPVLSKKGSKKSIDTSITQGVKKGALSSKSISKKMVSSKNDPASLTVSSQKSISKSSKSIMANTSAFVFSPPTSLPQVQTFRVFPSKKNITFNIAIKRSLLSTAGSFYLLMELENELGVKVSSCDKTIPHARILNSFLTPRTAPTLEAEYVKPGVITIMTKKHKRDLKSRRIKVFRRLSAPESGGTDFGTQWTEVFDSSISDTGEFTFRDVVATSRPVIYRAVCYGENFKPSEKFASTVVLPVKQFVKKQTGALTAIAKVNTPGTNSYVQIDIKDIPYDIVSVMVRRYNITTSSYSEKMSRKGAGFIYVGSSPALQQITVTDVDNDSTVSFMDKSAKIGNNYSYVPIGITRAGKEIVGSSFALEIPLSPNRAQVSLSVSSPQAKDGAIEMDLSGKFTDFGFSEVRRALSAGQQAGLFTEDLLEDRSRFESLIGFLVERTNGKTGETESFGTYTAGKFIDDSKSRADKNIKELEPGVEYVYIVTALLNSPETLFPTLVKKEIDIKTLLPYTSRISKFQNTLSLNKSTLQSTARQVNRSLPSALEPSDPLIAGRTNVQVYKEYRVPVSLSNKSGIRVEHHKSFNRIIWTYNDPDSIDHFRIYLSSFGGKVLIDTVHCDSSSSEFYYRHYEEDFGVNFRYEIQPIDLSYKELKKISTNMIKPIDFSSILNNLGFNKIEKL